ncbi:50S ribosomal protein L3 N(5)-glutamine methyltransferase [Terasakiispira papahanaumokuakeensis]|uniref:50S ribosomal protein L3 N(5)-glutamine methyltransferase n=1 Tax=Terasakiispira papahanaumokuakeensis TaxID=197479 RepID=UPI000A43B066|nr:50S ribosomal protein L3 N(5)-glutamine methyltransferase [Terasakiispira papahanaumokuakeensis]
MSQSLTAVAQELHSVRDYIRWALTRFNRHQLFYGHGTDNAWDEAVQLVLGALHLPWDTDHSILDARLVQSERETVLNMIERRCSERVPLPYLLGEAWFAGMLFKVDPRVLIPRSPIGELIQHAFQPWIGEENTPERLLDMCTGSGCIGIACAQAFPTAEIVLSDLSADALDVAQENIQLHHMEDRVTTVQSDLFEHIEGRFDMIVSNPPYVDIHDLSLMPEEFCQEPELALAAGDDGLDLVRLILRDARQYLTDDGLLIVEVGNSDHHLEHLYPEVSFLWLEFSEGGHGVFLLTAAQLDAHQTLFNERALRTA